MFFYQTLNVHGPDGHYNTPGRPPIRARSTSFQFVSSGATPKRRYKRIRPPSKPETEYSVRVVRRHNYRVRRRRVTDAYTITVRCYCTLRFRYSARQTHFWDRFPGLDLCTQIYSRARRVARFVFTSASAWTKTNQTLDRHPDSSDSIVVFYRVDKYTRYHRTRCDVTETVSMKSRVKN